jgi:hypothetical protein
MSIDTLIDRLREFAKATCGTVTAANGEQLTYEDSVIWLAADSLASTQAEILRLKAALEEAQRPNLFWDDDNPEESFTSIEDLADYIGVRSIAMRVRLAKSLPDRWVSAIQGEDEWAITYHDNHDEAFAELNRARSLSLDGEEGV